jgi:hypothetical protein
LNQFGSLPTIYNRKRKPSFPDAKAPLPMNSSTDTIKEEGNTNGVACIETNEKPNPIRRTITTPSPTLNLSPPTSPVSNLSAVVDGNQNETLLNTDVTDPNEWKEMINRINTPPPLTTGESPRECFVPERPNKRARIDSTTLPLNIPPRVLTTIVPTSQNASRITLFSESSPSIKVSHSLFAVSTLICLFV